MSDDLAERLRAFGEFSLMGSTFTEAADRIEALEAELARYDPVLNLRDANDTLRANDGTVVYFGPGQLYEKDDE